MCDINYNYSILFNLIKKENNEEDNGNIIGELFLKVYKNLYLRNEIGKHLKLFSKYKDKKFKNCKELNQFPFKEYISTLELIGNQEINGTIPKTVSTLKCGGYFFNQKIRVGDIPDSITSLEFGDAFNRRLNIGTIPNSVKSLSFGIEFNQSFKNNVLPLSLTNLKFGESYNQSLSNRSLSKCINLKSIEFGFFFNHSINSLPSSVTLLTINHIYPNLSRSTLPPNVKVVISNKPRSNFKYVDKK